MWNAGLQSGIRLSGFLRIRSSDRPCWTMPLAHASNYAMKDYLERGEWKPFPYVDCRAGERLAIWQLSGGQTHLLALSGAVSLRSRRADSG